MPFNFEEVIDSLDAVPTEYQTAYTVGADKKFKLQDTFKPFVSAIVGTNVALGKTRTDLGKANKEAADRRGLLKKLEDLATTLNIDYSQAADDGKPALSDAISTFVNDLVTKGTKGGGELKISLDKIKAEYEKRFGDLDTAGKAEKAQMQSALERYLIGQQVTASLAKHGGNVKLLQDIVAKSVKVFKDGEDYVVRVVDADGSARSDGKGGWLSIDDYIGNDLKRNTDYAAAFKSETKSGNGAPATGASRQASNTNVNKQDKGDRSSVSRISAGLAAGQYERGTGRRVGV